VELLSYFLPVHSGGRVIKMFKKLRFRTIRARILVMLLPLAILPLLILTAISYQSSSSIINDQIDEKMDAMLSSTSQSIVNLLAQHSKIPESLARNVEVNGMQMTKEQYVELLQKYVGMNQQTLGAGVWFELNKYRADIKFFGPYIYRDGEKLVYTEDYSTEEYDYPHWDWYKLGKETKDKLVCIMMMYQKRRW
jgi:methyl-accepting chemotaxis protein